MNNPKKSVSPTPRMSGRLRGLALAALIASGVAAAYVTAAPSAWADVAGTSTNGHAAGGLFQHLHGGHSPAQLHAHFDTVLSQAGVDDAQKQQIQTLIGHAMDAQHADMRRYHASVGQLKSLLSAATLDNAAITATRAEQDRLMLVSSRRLDDTAVAIARILTPMQRVTLGAQIDRMMASHTGHPFAG